MASFHSAIQINFWFELQLQITEMLPQSSSTPHSTLPKSRFIKTLSHFSEQFPLTFPLIPGSPQDSASFASSLQSGFPHYKKQRNLAKKGTLDCLAQYVNQTLKRCSEISFRLFKIVDIIGCGEKTQEGRLGMFNSNEVHLVKGNKIVKFQIDSNEFKNELELTDIYYENQAEEQSHQDLGKLGKYLDNSSTDFFSTTREFTLKKKTLSLMSSSNKFSVSCFQTPNKSSKKVLSSSMKKIQVNLGESPSLICKSQHNICDIPNSMKIRLFAQNSPEKEKLQDSDLISKKIIFRKSAMGSVRKILFDDIDTENGSIISENDFDSNAFSINSTFSDSLSFSIKRDSPCREINQQEAIKSRSHFSNEKYSWLSLFRKNINSFGMSLNFKHVWIIDNNKQLIIICEKRPIKKSKVFHLLDASVCKWIKKDLLVCGTTDGKLVFGKIQNNELKLVKIWTVSEKEIKSLKICPAGVSLSCIDKGKRLYSFCLKQLLNNSFLSKNLNPLKKLNMKLGFIFKNVRQIMFHPKKLKILIILKTFPRNEIIFYNLSTKQIIHTHQFISKTHSFCIHQDQNILFFSQTSKNSNFIKIIQFSQNFKKFKEIDSFGHKKSKLKYENLHIKFGSLIAKNKNQNLFIWKQNDFENSDIQISKKSSFINRNNLLR